MNDVSRETPSVPDEARRVFSSERLPLAERYVELLATAGVERGLIGPREAPRLWERHIFNCAAVAEAVPEHATVADLGAGAGLPGIVLAIVRPDLIVTLVEPLLRRTRFLDEVVAELALAGTTVRRDRAEALRTHARFDVVTARALAPLSRLLGWAMPLVSPDGVLLAMKGDSAADEIADATVALRKLRCSPPEVLTLGGRAGVSTATVVRVAHADPARVS
jgi:16S rRNA (guanine527-N7)-methyltransferase